MKKDDIKIDKKDLEIANLYKQIIDKEQIIAEVTNNWKRALADYQNLQKREAEQKINLFKFASRNFIEKLLPVVDTLEKLHQHLKDQGLELALKEMHKILQDENVEKMSVLGKDFDVTNMEAVTMVEGKENNKVVSIVRPGYLMHGSVLRVARVIVSKKKV